jgi:hypothetical protein
MKSVRSKVWDQVRIKLSNQLHERLHNQLCIPMHNQLRVSEQLRNQLYSLIKENINI